MLLMCDVIFFLLVMAVLFMFPNPLLFFDIVYHELEVDVVDVVGVQVVGRSWMWWIWVEWWLWLV